MQGFPVQLGRATRLHCGHVSVGKPNPRLRTWPIRYMGLGIPLAVMDVPPGTAGGIARFYREVLGTPAERVEDNEGPAQLFPWERISSLSLKNR
ncbi:MAG: hypothetical protein Ct9H300mP8_13240 [Gammaproteobacteria bacterium]|nr:MAG: hypothetical protein Ct9H300mP8_13240 [Gammaproteobacteria bacterium]